MEALTTESKKKHILITLSALKGRFYKMSLQIQNSTTALTGKVKYEVEYERKKKEVQ